MGRTTENSRAPDRRNRRRQEKPSSPVGQRWQAITGFLASKECLFAAALVVAVFLAYQPAWHGGFLFDDRVHLLDNPALRPGGLTYIWAPGSFTNYWPLTFTVYGLEYRMWGLDPLGYHLVNLALHALSALLVWRVLGQLRVPGALLAAALFALHPVNVESAAWIAQLNGVLSLLLALVSLLLYLKFEQRGDRGFYACAIAAFLLSALAKGEALTLPIVMLTCAWWQRGRIEWRDVLRVVPFFAISLVMAGVEIWSEHFLQASDVIRTDGFFSRLAGAGWAVWFYLGKLLWPVDLSQCYPRWTIDSHSAATYLPGLLWVGLLVCAWWQRNAWGRPVVMLIVCYTALLAPVLGFVNIGFMRFSLVADHWQHPAMIVPCAVFASVATTLARRICNPAAAKVAALALLAALAWLTWQQAATYADAETSYRAMIQRNPACWLAYDNLGKVLDDRGDDKGAFAYYQKALELNPNYAEAHSNLGSNLARRGKVDEAIDEFQQALQFSPNLAEAHSNLGAALASRNQLDQAIAEYRKALRIKPDLALAHNNLGLALESKGQLDEAIAEFEQALYYKPDYPSARQNLESAQARQQ